MDLLTYALLKEKIDESVRDNEENIDELSDQIEQLRMNIDEKVAILDAGIMSILSKKGESKNENVTDSVWQKLSNDLVDIFISIDGILYKGAYFVENSIATITQSNNTICTITLDNSGTKNEYIIAWENNVNDVDISICEKGLIAEQLWVNGTGTNAIKTKNASSASGDDSVAEGSGTMAGGHYSHAEGLESNTDAVASHTEGYRTTVHSNTIAGHAEGYQTVAGSSNGSGSPGSHAEGLSTVASGGSSHSEGMNTVASNQASHAEGSGSVASGTFSHAQNIGTIAQGNAQTAIGKYNVADSDNLFIIGNGTNNSNRSNAMTIDASGNEVLSGKLTVGIAPTNNMDVTTKQYVDGQVNNFYTGFTKDNNNYLSSSSVNINDVADEVADLKSAISDLNIDVECDLMWEQGGINLSGIEGDSNTRIRTKEYFLISKTPINVTLQNGYKISTRLYASANESSFISASGWLTDNKLTLTPEVGKYIRFVFAYTNDANITPTAASNISITQEYLTDKTLTKSNKAADAKATGDALSTKADTDIVNEIKTIVDSFIVDAEIVVTWVQGVISLSGVDGGSDTRIRTDGYYLVSKEPIKIAIPNGYKISTRLYASDDAASFISGSNWLTDATIILNPGMGKYIRFVLAYTNDTNIVPSAGANISISQDGITDKTLSIPDKAADAKTVGDALQQINDDFNGEIIIPILSGGAFGSVDQAGIIRANDYRAHTKYIPIDSVATIYPKEDANISVYYYDEDFTYLGRTYSWIGAGSSISPYFSGAMYFVLNIKYTDDRIVDDPSDFVDKIQIIGKYNLNIQNVNNRLLSDNLNQNAQLLDSRGKAIIERGLIDMNTGIETASTTRVRTVPFYKINDIENVTSNDSTVRFTWRIYDEDHRFIKGAKNWVEPYTFVSKASEAVAVFNSSEFEIGSIGLSGADGVSTTRARTINYVTYKPNDSISVSDGWQYSVRLYDKYKWFLKGTSSWIDEEKTLTQIVALIGTINESDVGFYRIVIRQSNDAEIQDLTTVVGEEKSVVLSHNSVPTFFRFCSMIYGEQDNINVSAMEEKIILKRNVSNARLYDLIEANKQKPTIFTTRTGNCSIRAAKEITYDDGTPPKPEWYLLEEPVTHKFYYSKDLKSKIYMFTFDGNPSDYSMGVTSSGDIVCCLDANAIPYPSSPDSSGYYNGDDALRKNPYVFLASENWTIQHEVDFGNRTIKPSGWLGSGGFKCLPDGTIMFAEYTRACVKTCNAWKVTGNLLNANNWTIMHSQTLSGHPDYGVKHYHGVMFDHFTGVLYLLTGDDDNGAAVDYSTDEGETWTRFSVVINGQTRTTSEKYFRIVNLLFTKDYIYWAGDTSLAAYHKVWRGTRDTNGVLDFSTVEIIGNLPRYAKDGRYINMATYGSVLLPDLNAILLLERIDGTLTPPATTAPIRLVDLSVQGSSDTPDDQYTDNIIEIYNLERVSQDGNTHLGFRTRYADWYPRGTKTLVGFDMMKELHGLAVNVNKGFGNGGVVDGTGEDNINNLSVRVYKNSNGFRAELDTEYI